MNPAPEDCGPLLERFRAYLTLLARLQVAPRLQGKVDLSGVVQQTLLEAYQALDQLCAMNHERQAAWLRAALAHNLTDEVRHLGRAVRDVRRECSLEQAVTEGTEPKSTFFVYEPTRPQPNFTPSVYIYDIAACQVRHILVGHRDTVGALAFSPDGKTLATGGDQGTVKLWCVATGQELLTLPHPPSGAISQIRFSADQSVLAADAGAAVYWWVGADKGQVDSR